MLRTIGFIRFVAAGVTVCAATGWLSLSSSEAQMKNGPSRKGGVAEIPELQPDTGQLPPELQALEMQRPQMEPPQVRTTREQLIQKVKGRKQKEAKGGEAEPEGLQPDTGQLPQELQALEMQRPQTEPPKMRSTKEQLKQKLLQMPGKREAIERLKQKKAANQKTGWNEGIVELLTWLNPLSTTTAEAQYTYVMPPSPTSGQEWHADMANGFCQRNPDGSIPLYADLYKSTVFYPRYGYVRLSASSSAYARVVFAAPQAGTYVIAFTAFGGATLTSSAGTMESWTAGSGWHDYVTTAYLQQGTYSFYYRPQSNAYLKGVTVTPY